MFHDRPAALLLAPGPVPAWSVFSPSVFSPSNTLAPTVACTAAHRAHGSGACAGPGAGGGYRRGFPRPRTTLVDAFSTCQGAVYALPPGRRAHRPRLSSRALTSSFLRNQVKTRPPRQILLPSRGPPTGTETRPRLTSPPLAGRTPPARTSAALETARAGGHCPPTRRPVCASDADTVTPTRRSMR
eukprot:scaffold19960_cov129-Isochrysis_galbana.AAC.1